MKILNLKKKFLLYVGHEGAWIQIQIGIDFKSWIRIYIDFKSLIQTRFRIETNTDLKHWFQDSHMEAALRIFFFIASPKCN